MPRVIYLGLQAFANKPQELLPMAEHPLALATLSSSETQIPLNHDGPLLLQHLTQDDQRLLSDWLKQEAARELTIAWPQPQAWLAARLTQGAPLQETLDEWAQQGKSLLRLFRAARRQIRLVGYTPGGSLETLASPIAGERLLPVYQLAAAQLLAHHATVREVHDYLQASSQESQDETQESTALVAAVLKSHDEQQLFQQQAKQSQVQLQQVNAERDRQQQELSRLKGELQGACDDKDHYLAQLQKVQTSLEERNSEKQIFAQRMEKATASAEENGRLLKQVNAERDQQQQTIARLKGEVTAAREEYAVALQQLQDVQQALEVKADDQRVKALEEKNTQLLSQLNSVQRSLEKSLSEKQQIQKDCDNTRTAQQRLEKEKSALKQAVDTQHQEYQTILQTLQDAQSDNAQLLVTLQQVQQSYDELNLEHEALAKRKDRELEHQQRLVNTQLEQQQRLVDAQQQNLDSVVSKLEQRVAELHKAQEQLEKSSLDQAYLRQQLEKRQKELNMLRASSQQHIHHLERLVQWLRVHAQRHAAAAYREIRSYKKTLPKQAAMLEASRFFDADWYLEQYPDVAQAGLKPAEHFIKFGAIDGRDPGPLFSTDFYLTYYDDVAASGQHPLLHYLRHGITEQRETRPEQRHLPAPQTPAEEGK